MNMLHEKLARQYARAFYNANGSNAIQLLLIEQLEKLAVFFSQNPMLLLTLASNHITLAVANTFTNSLLRSHGCDAVLAPLICQLTMHHRLALLSRIAQHLENLYNKEHNRCHFTAYSSHALQEPQKNIIIAFIKAQTNIKEVIVTFKVCSTLISGLRISSESMMWERSVQKTLLLMKQRLLART
jgi:F0F1-type ATP synthase delta subunit